MANGATKKARAKTAAKTAANGWAHTGDVWRKRVIQNVTLPSGQRVTIRIPGLSTLARLDGLPKELAELALLELSRTGGAAAALAGQFRQAAAGDEGAADEIRASIERLRELTKHLVVEALEPMEIDGVVRKLTYTDLDDVPEGDLEKLMRIVSRRDPLDSRGAVIGAMETDELVLWQEHHNCLPDCEACAKVAADLSTVAS